MLERCTANLVIMTCSILDYPTFAQMSLCDKRAPIYLQDSLLGP